MSENKKQTQEVDEKEKVSESQEEESELEEKVEQEEETFVDDQFHEFIQPSTESVSPVLEKVETFEQESLEQNVGSAPIQTDSEEKDSVKYSQESNYIEENATKYQKSVEPPVLSSSVRDSSLRQEFLHTPKEIDFSPQESVRPEPIHAGFVEREQKLPFENDSKKYKEAKLEHIK